MNSQHKRIRAELSAMAPRRAVEYILSFELPQDEAACLIECDVRRKSYAQVCEALHLSPEAVNRCRRRAYQKIADGQREHRG
nr:MAG TPA: ECF sigma factor [Caudoviricetes sp.]